MLAELVADGASTTFVADDRLEAVDAARGCIGCYHVLPEPL